MWGSFEAPPTQTGWTDQFQSGGGCGRAAFECVREHVTARLWVGPQDHIFVSLLLDRCELFTTRHNLFDRAQAANQKKACPKKIGAVEWLPGRSCPLAQAVEIFPLW